MWSGDASTVRRLSQGEVLSRAFELARFLRPRREEALEIAQRALLALETAVAVQDKRLYYRPRAGDGRSRRSKVFLAEAHLLQRLVCAEAERALPSAGSSEELVAGFVAAVVRRGMERNSFHATLAVTRILHDYTTREGSDMHTLLVGPGPLGRAEDYWRARKHWMMAELKQLYGDRLHTSRGAHGEERFETLPEPGPLADVVRETLARLTPWETECPQSNRARALDDPPDVWWRDDEGEDAREIERMHLVLHPDCFARLVAGLGLDSPDSRLAIPRFPAATLGGDDERGGGRPDRDTEAAISEDESRRVLAALDDQAGRRRRAPAGTLRILVDGVLAAELVPSRADRCAVRVAPEAGRVDVVSVPRHGQPALLAWLPLERTSSGDAFRPLSRRVTLEGGQRIGFLVRPDAAGGAEVVVDYAETAWARRLALGARRLSLAGGRHGAWVPVALVLAVAAVAGLLVRELGRSTPGGPTAAPASPGTAPRGVTSPVPAPTVAPSARLRPLGEGPTRSVQRGPRGASLAEVSLVWADVTGPGPDGFHGRLREGLTAAGLRLARGPEDAEAALQVEASPGSGPAPVRLRVRLVNAAGAVLWPPGGQDWTFAGTEGDAIVHLVRALRAVLPRSAASSAAPGSPTSTNPAQK
jgi:hypothetical protein